MTYWFSEEADNSLSKFSQEVTEKIISFIEEAREENFYNHESYSYVYDHHRNPWDKLDLKEEGLNHRVFFMKKGEEFVILEIFERGDLDYEDREFYNLLDRIAKRNKE